MDLFLPAVSILRRVSLGFCKFWYRWQLFYSRCFVCVRAHDPRRVRRKVDKVGVAERKQTKGHEGHVSNLIHFIFTYNYNME